MSRQTGGMVQLVNVHFSSKSGSAPVFGTKQPFSKWQDDLQVNDSVDDRLAQANAVRSFVANSATTNKILLCDFSNFQFNTPVTTLADGFSIMKNTLAANERYSYNFKGNAQSLDQILLCNNLVSTAQFQPVHVNSEFFVQASDHDPLIALVNI